jgi:hypothetical protein
MDGENGTGRIHFEREGFIVRWDEDGMSINATDYHAGTLYLEWKTVLEIARRAGYVVPFRKKEPS